MIPDGFASGGKEYDIVSICEMSDCKTHSISLTGLRLLGSMDFMGFGYMAGTFNETTAESVTLDNVETAPLLSGSHSHFFNAKSLKTVTVIDSVVGPGLFTGCASMVSASVKGGDVSDSMFSGEGLTFVGCKNLSELNLTDVERIGSSAFKGCRSLTSVDLSGVRIVGDMAFAGTGISELVVPSSVEEMSFSNGDGTTYFDTMDVRFVDNPYFSSEGGLVYSTRDGARTILAATKEFSTPDLVLEDVRVGEGVFRKNADYEIGRASCRERV